MWTPQEEARLQHIQGILGLGPKAALPPPRQGLLGRIGNQTANLPSNIAEGMIQGFQGLNNMLVPPSHAEPYTEVPKPYDIAPPTTGGEMAVDIGAGLASLIPAALAPEMAVGKAAQLAGMGVRGSRLLGAGVGWSMLGAPHGPEEAGIQGGLGVLATSTVGVPMKARIPLALLSGVAGYAEGSRRSPVQGAILGGVNALLPFAEPALAALTRSRAINAREVQADTAPPPGMDLTGGIHATGEGTYGAGLDPLDAFATLQRHGVLGQPAPQANLIRVEPPPQANLSRIERVVQMQDEADIATARLAQTFPEDAGGGLMQIEPPNPAFHTGEAGLSLLPRPTEPSTNLLMDMGNTPVSRGLLPERTLRPGFSESGFGPKPDIHLLPDPARPAVPLPEQPIFPLQPEAPTTPPQPLTSTPEQVATLQKPVIEDIVPAIRINGEVHEGVRGETHQDILNRYKATASDDDAVMALMDFDTKENPNFFKVKGGTQEFARDQLQALYGVNDSQGLRKLQGAEAPPIATLQTPTESSPIHPFQEHKVKFTESGKLQEGTVVGKEGDTLTIKVEDPIKGERTAYILESETRPMEGPKTPATPHEGRPFTDIPDAPTIKSKAGGEFDDLDDLLRNRDSGGYAIDEDGNPIPWDEIPDPGAPSDDLIAYLQRYKSQTIGQASKELSGLGGMILKDMMQRILKAAGKEDMRVRFTSDERSFSRVGSMNTMTGDITIGWDYAKRLLRDWKQMKPTEQAETILTITKLLGHEVSHAALKVGRTAGLEINGRSLSSAIEHEVMSMPLTTRQFIAGEIKEAVGEKGIISNYLAGDIDAVHRHYLEVKPTMTKVQARTAAAEEFMVELMSLELHRRADIKGLPGTMRAVIDRLKNVVVGVLNYFRGVKSNVAALQNLQAIAVTALDHFKKADAVDMAGAFPASKHWEARANRQLKDANAMRGFQPHTEPTDPMDWIVLDMASGHPPTPPTSKAFLENELVHLGARVAVGGAIGGAISGDQVTTAEGVLLGGIVGAFGPTVARRILSSNLVEDGLAAAKVGKGNPIKTLEALFQGKTLKQLGGEALFTERNGVARFVRAMEIGLGINFDRKLRGILEHSRGLAAEQMSVVHDALMKAKNFAASDPLKVATLQYLEGKIDMPTFALSLTTAEEKAYGTLISTARSATDNLQKLFASGLKNGSFKDTVLKSIGSYTGKFYTAYTKGEFEASAFAKAKADLKTAFPKYSDDVADSIMYQYMREVKANRNVFGRVSTTGQQLDPTLWKGRLATESEIEAQQAIVDALTPGTPDHAAALSKLHYQQSHKITDGWGEWLGEIKDPKERILRTFQKLYSSSISGKTFDLLSTHVDSFGLKFTYGAEELSKAQEAIAFRLSKMAPTDPAFATLQNQADELKYYVPLPSGAQYGKLSGKMVNRFVRDSIATDTSPFKWMEQPVFRAISEFNNFIKLGRTAFNPITVIRNYMQMPLFGLIAKTNTTDLVEAWQHIRKRTDVNRIMLREGITSVDMTAAELTDGPGRLFSGFFDSDAATRIATHGIEKALSIYRAPDTVLRGGTFISAVKRMAGGDLAKGLADASIVERARDFTNRYTMNYHAVPQIIKVGRQLPFVSLFLSYTAEITRILKNLVQDAVSPTADSAGRMHALGILGGMAAIPALLVAAGEGSLSTKDRREWEKVKTLSPAYAKMRFRIPLGRNENGSFRYMDLTNLLPADAYSMMVRAIAQGDYKTAASVNPVLNLTNTPLLNIATEQITGKDTQTGTAIRGLDRGREVLKEILPPITPGIGYEAERIANAFTPNDKGGLGLTNSRTGRSVMPSDIVMNYLTGMKFATVNPDTIQRGYIAEAKQQIAEQQMLLRQITSTDATQAKKQAAMEQFNSAVKEIMLQMHEKLDLGAK